MKNNIFAIIVIICLAFFIIGASSGCSKEKLDFNSTGLIMNFVSDAPPSLINYGIGFQIYSEVRNMGGYDVVPGTASFYLSGIGSNLVGVQEKLFNTVNLVKSSNVQQGGSEILRFAANAQAAQHLPQAFNLTMKLTSCYDYTTVTQTSVCVGEGSGVCTLEGNKIITGSNSNAPIQVSELTESVLGNQLTISFKISNLGSGNVYLTDANCDKLQQEDLNEQLKKDQVNIAIQTEQGITCSLQSAQPPYGSFQGLEGMVPVGTTVTCTKTLTGAESNLAPFGITLSYKYREDTTTTMTILP
jgi:hypothetical protein